MARAATIPARDDVGARDVLLTAAADLMVERSDIEISLSDIAQRAGLNAALFKYYFGNKSGMLLALVRSVIRVSLAQLQELAAMPIGAEEKIRLHIRGLVNTYDRHPFLNRLLHFMLSSEDENIAATLAQELVRPVAAAQRAILDQGVREGVFRPVDPTLFYFHLNGACEALFYSRAALRHGFDIGAIDRDMKQSYVDYLSATLLSGILVGKPGSAGAAA